MDGRKIGRLLGKRRHPRPRDVPVYLFCRGLDYGDSGEVGGLRGRGCAG